MESEIRQRIQEIEASAYALEKQLGYLENLKNISHWSVANSLIKNLTQLQRTPKNGLGVPMHMLEMMIALDQCLEKYLEEE